MSANICSICSSKMVKTVREMLRNHRGLSELRRIKAVFWWCYMHTEAPLEPAEMLRSMPRNKDLQTLINALRPHRGESTYISQYIWKRCGVLRATSQRFLSLYNRITYLRTFCSPELTLDFFFLGGVLLLLGGLSVLYLFWKMGDV